jgi:hypothetical protein
MASSGVQDQLAAELAQSFNRPINVSVIEKAKKFPFLQELGFSGQLVYAKDQFHGLNDYYKQMTIYSGSTALLTPSWAATYLLAKLNGEVTKLLMTSPTLGPVGPAFRKLVGFDQVFAVSPDELKTGGKAAILSKLPF